MELPVQFISISWMQQILKILVLEFVFDGNNIHSTTSSHWSHNWPRT